MQPLTLTTRLSSITVHDVDDHGEVYIEMPLQSIYLTPSQLDELIHHLQVIKRAPLDQAIPESKL